MPQDRETARRRYARDPGFRATVRAGNRNRPADHRNELRRRYAEDPQYRERILAANRKWKADHRPFYKDADNARKRHRHATDADYRERYRAARRGARARAVRLKTRYGMTPADYDAMLARQNGVCAICKTDGRKLNIDHNHKTNAVRGLLCNACNLGLGNFGDDPGFLRMAADYAAAPGAPNAFKFRPYRQSRRGQPPSSSTQPKEAR